MYRKILSAKMFLWLFLGLTLISFNANSQEIIYYEDFESGQGFWYADNGIWEIGKATVGPKSAHSGQNVAGTILSGNYPYYANTRLVSPSISIPKVNIGEKIQLYFWQWFLINEEDFYGPDLGYVQISVNGGPWKNLHTNICGYSWLWTQLCLDLTYYTDSRIRIAFYFVSSQRAENNGWYIDDIMIKKGPPIFRNPEDFEAGIGDWSADNGVWEIGKPTSGPTTAHSGQNCAATILSGNYPTYTNTLLISPEIKLITEPNEVPGLYFWHWFRINEDDFYGPDQGFVMISVNRGTWKTIAGPYSGISERWTQSYADLSAYADSTVRIAFAFYSSQRAENCGWFIDDIRIVGIPPDKIDYPEGRSIPNEFTLNQNYPNPFNPSTTIEFSIPHSTHVSLKIYDVLGKEVSTLVDEELPMGQHKVNWNAQHLASGVYIYKIQAGEFVQTKKMILMR